jgi:transposase
LQRTWGAKGETPIVQTSVQRQKDAISAVNASGAFWYDVYTAKFNAQMFISKLKAFMRNRKRPVFLVLDGHPAHRAKIVAAYVQSLKGRLELHFLPGYAPDLNPDEFVWNYLRQNGVTKTPLKQNEKLKDRVEKDLAQIKRSPRLVRSFFRAESVGYIMD